MKKLITLFLFIILAGYSAQAQTAQKSSYILVPSDVDPCPEYLRTSAQTDSCPDYEGWRIIPLEGRYYVCSLTEDLKAQNNRVSIPVIDTLTFIDTLVPEKIFIQVYWDKEVEIKKSDTLWMEFGKWWPIMKRSTTSQRAVLIGSEIVCRDVPEEIAKELPRNTRIFSFILLGFGLFFGILWASIWKRSGQKMYPDFTMILMTLIFALIPLIFLTTDINWFCAIYGCLCILLGETSVLIGYGWYRKRTKEVEEMEEWLAE